MKQICTNLPDVEEKNLYIYLKNSIDSFGYDCVQNNMAISNQIWLLTGFTNISSHDDLKTTM